MLRPLACSNCRQDNIGCDAHSLAPDPCTRCRKRDLTCTIEASFRRIPTRHRLQHLSQEVQDLKQSLNRTANSAASASPVECESKASDISKPVDIEQRFLKSNFIESSVDQVLARLGDVILVHSVVNALFREYFQRYHPLFPILDSTITPSAIHKDCSTLFWVVVTTASRSMRPELYTALCDIVPHLISGNFFHHSYSVQPCQALLILCMFPLPLENSREDVRWVYSGIAMQMAMLAGLHTTGSAHEYRNAGALRAVEKDQRDLNRTWYCCCYVNATLSAEFGLPSSIPQDVLDMEELNRAALPVDFISAIRITLESTKIGKLIDPKMSTNPPTDKDTTQLGLLGMLESDLNVLANSMRTTGGKLSSVTEFSLLVAKLSLCAFGLKQATKVRTCEATQLRLSAFSCSTRLIQLFVGTPFVSAQADVTGATPSLPIQIYYPRAYWKGLLYACLALQKLSLTETLPELETINSELALQQAVDLLSACSTEEGDEFHRAVGLIRILGQKSVQEIVKARHEVKSRMGASLMYEMLLSAVLWKKRNAADHGGDPRNWPQNNKLIWNNWWMDNSFSVSDMSPQLMDELIASSDYQFNGMPMELDANFWDTSMIDELFAFDAAANEHDSLRSPALS